MEDKYFTPSKIGRIVGVHHNTILRWIEQGKLKAYTTLGGHRRIWLEDLLEFLAVNSMRIPESLSSVEKEQGNF